MVSDYALRSELIGELNRLRAKERALLDQVQRRDAAIRAVRELRDTCVPRSQSWNFYNRALAAIDAALEAGQ